MSLGAQAFEIHDGLPFDLPFGEAPRQVERQLEWQEIKPETTSLRSQKGEQLSSPFTLHLPQHPLARIQFIL
jgi:hypothetical protein